MGVGWVWKIIFLLVMAILGFHVLFYDPVLKRGWKLAHFQMIFPLPTGPPSTWAQQSAGDNGWKPGRIPGWNHGAGKSPVYTGKTLGTMGLYEEGYQLGMANGTGHVWLVGDTHTHTHIYIYILMHIYIYILIILLIFINYINWIQLGSGWDTHGYNTFFWHENGSKWGKAMIAMSTEVEQADGCPV